MSEQSEYSAPNGVPFIHAGVAANDPWQDYVEIRFAIRSADGKTYVAKPVEFHEPVSPDGIYCQGHRPMLVFCRKSMEGQRSLQKLMNDLWALGLRPSDMGTANQIAALERHLADFRALLAKTMGVELPK